MPGRINLTSSGIENLRRSITMLTPLQPSGLAREDAIVLLEEVQRLQRRCGQLETGMGQALAELEEKLHQLLAD